MKALMYTALRQLEIQDIEDPRPGPGEVLVRVCATGICGSDVHGFLGRQKRRQPGLVFGHETLGVVVEAGTSVDTALVGKRVSVNPLISCGLCANCRAGRQSCCASWRLLGLDQTHGGFAEYVTAPARNCYPLPDHVSDAAAVMIEPLANAFHLLSHIDQKSPLLPSAVLFGAGTLGAAILTVALSRGVRVLVVSEPNPARARVAEQLGADFVLDPRQTDVVEEVIKRTDGLGVDVALDAVGRAETRQAAANCVTRGGAALLLGLDDAMTEFDFSVLIRREVRLQCSYTYGEREFEAALDFVIRKAVDFTPWTDVLPMTEGQSAFDRLVADPGDRLKIALVP